MNFFSDRAGYAKEKNYRKCLKNKEFKKSWDILCLKQKLLEWHKKVLKNTITHFSSVNIYLCRPVFLRCKCVNTFLAG